MNIPMLDLKAEYALLKDEIEPAVCAALAACQYIGGPNVKAFEAEAAAYAGVKHAISCASGTDALLIALRAIGLGPGDEVITTPFTFVATASTVVMCGAKPVFVDIDPRTFNLDLDQVAAAITPLRRPSCRCTCSASRCIWRRSRPCARSTA
jgi:dTDP-4-amino-4,6-dideoxygalactose transaminase